MITASSHIPESDIVIAMKSFIIIAVLVIVCCNADCQTEASVKSQDNPDADKYLCGSRGWTQVAYLNMSDPSQQCPPELTLYDEDGVRACGRQTSSTGSCSSVTFLRNDVHVCYTQVCGRVIAYQYGTPEGLLSDNIDDPYVDGISITHGSPRQHLWTLMGFYTETKPSCPCSDGSTDASLPSFIGEDYFCESGNPNTTWPFILYKDDLLWDGEQCGGLEGPCCSTPCVPWFHKVFPSYTGDDIELRVCSDQSTRADDTPISLYEIYIK